jgi:hypothetical protein
MFFKNHKKKPEFRPARSIYGVHQWEYKDKVSLKKEYKDKGH